MILSVSVVVACNEFKVGGVAFGSLEAWLFCV
jgi:hypothetical protein